MGPAVARVTAKLSTLRFGFREVGSHCGGACLSHRVSTLPRRPIAGVAFFVSCRLRSVLTPMSSLDNLPPTPRDQPRWMPPCTLTQRGFFVSCRSSRFRLVLTWFFHVAASSGRGSTTHARASCLPCFSGCTFCCCLYTFRFRDDCLHALTRSRVMETPVSDEFCKQTKRCPRAFQCQEPDGKPRCDAIRLIGEGLLPIPYPSGQTCPYLVNYGKGHFCMCPTRAEIFKRHGI